MRILIVGGSSYLGRFLCRKLADICQVWGTYFRNNIAFAGTRSHLDVSDRNETANILRRIEPDVIFYLACDYSDLETSIIKGTRNFLNARQMYWHDSHFVYVSSDAVFDGAISRLRPVLMTAITSALGLIPMLLSNGVGAEIQKPLASVIVGGLVTATFLTLFVLPVLFARFSKGKLEEMA